MQINETQHHKKWIEKIPCKYTDEELIEKWLQPKRKLFLIIEKMVGLGMKRDLEQLLNIG